MIGLVRVHIASYGDAAVGYVFLVQKAVRIIYVVDGGLQFPYIVVESRAGIVTVLVLVVETGFDEVPFVPFPFQPEAGVPFFLVQLAEVACGLLLVQGEEAEASLAVLDVHHLASVRFFAACLAVGSSPGQFPLFLSVQLMVPKGIYMGGIVAAGQFVAFGVFAFPALIGITGVAGVEEGVAYAVMFA